MGPSTNIKLYKAACVDFILFGLLTVWLFFYKKLPIVIVVCILMLCAVLLFKIFHGFQLIWYSLTKKSNHQINEKSSLVRISSDLEAQYKQADSHERPQNIRRSSPIQIPLRPSIENVSGYIPWRSSRPCLASIPWMGSRLASYYLDWRRKHATHGRRYTVSENITMCKSNDVPRIARSHTLSESTVEDFGISLQHVDESDIRIQHVEESGIKVH